MMFLVCRQRVREVITFVPYALNVPDAGDFAWRWLGRDGNISVAVFADFRSFQFSTPS